MSLHTTFCRHDVGDGIIGSPFTQVASPGAWIDVLGVRRSQPRGPCVMGPFEGLAMARRPRWRSFLWTDAPELHTLVQLGGCYSVVCVVGSETTETVTA